jgi:hypothetical protein
MGVSGPQLGVVALQEGENQGGPFDLRAFFPGSLRIVVTKDGKPAAGASVEAAASRGDQLTGVLDSLGEVQLGPLIPGDYSVVVRGSDWFAATGETVALSPAGEAHCRLDVVLHPGTFLVLDRETGAAVAEQTIWIVPRLSGETPSVAGGKTLRHPFSVQRQNLVNTDVEGRATVELAPGHYLISRENSRVFADLVWTTAGPLSPEVRIEPLGN